MRKAMLTACAAVVLGAMAPAQYVPMAEQRAFLDENFKKVWLIGDPIWLHPTRDVEFYTVAASLAHKSALEEQRARREQADEIFVRQLDEFDAAMLGELYDLHAESLMWAEHDRSEANQAITYHLALYGTMDQ